MSTVEQKRVKQQAVLKAKLATYQQLISDPDCNVCRPKATALLNEYKQLHHAFDKDYLSSASNKQPSLQPAKTGIDSTHTAPASGPPFLPRLPQSNSVVTIETPAETKQRHAVELDNHYRRLQDFLTTAGPGQLAEQERRYESYLQLEQQF